MSNPLATITDPPSPEVTDAAAAITDAAMEALAKLLMHELPNVTPHAAMALTGTLLVSAGIGAMTAAGINAAALDAELTKLLPA